MATRVNLLWPLPHLLSQAQRYSPRGPVAVACCMFGAQEGMIPVPSDAILACTTSIACRQQGSPVLS